MITMINLTTHSYTFFSCDDVYIASFILAPQKPISDF